MVSFQSNVRCRNIGQLSSRGPRRPLTSLVMVGPRNVSQRREYQVHESNGVASLHVIGESNTKGYQVVGQANVRRVRMLFVVL